MTIKAQTQPAHTQAGAPPLPVTLRAIAAWLESHPAARVDTIHFDAADRQVQPASVRGYLAGDDPSIEVRLADIGGEWVRDGRAFEREITPHAIYRLTDAR